MTTTTKTLHSRLDRLAEQHTGPAFALEVADRSELPDALAHWRRTHRTDPAIVLIIPERQYQPDWPPRGRG